MAVTDSMWPPRKNVAWRVTFPILDADGDLVTGAASDTPDSEISIDNGTFADVTAEITEVATASGMYFLELTAAEMNGDVISIIVKTATAGTKTTPIVVYPVTDSFDEITSNLVIIASDTAAIESELIVVHSETTALQADHVVIRSDLVISNSDTTAIHLQSTAIESELIIVHSETTVIASDVIVITSDTTAIESELIIVHSETTVIASDVIVITSDTTAIESELIVVHSDTTAIHSDTTIIHSDTIVISSDTTVIETQVGVMHSGLVAGACEGTPSTTVIQTNLAEATDDHYIGRIVVFTSGAGLGQASDITDYTGATGTITVTALTTAPSAADTFVIY